MAPTAPQALSHNLLSRRVTNSAHMDVSNTKRATMKKSSGRAMPKRVSQAKVSRKKKRGAVKKTSQTTKRSVKRVGSTIRRIAKRPAATKRYAAKRTVRATSVLTVPVPHVEKVVALGHSRHHIALRPRHHAD